MADTIDQGVKYTVEADASQAKKELADAGAAAMKGFNPLTAVSSAIHGNFAAMGQELAKLVPRFKSLGAAGGAAFGAVGAAVFGVVGAAKALKDLLQQLFNSNSLDKQFVAAGDRLFNIVESSKRLMESLSESRDRAERMSKFFEANANAIAKMTKAQNEFNRAQELALAKDEKSRSAINRKYDRMSRASDADTADKIAANRLNDLKNEEARLEAELRDSRKAQAEARKVESDMTKVARANTSTALSSFWGDVKSFFTGKTYANTKANAAFNAATDAGNLAADEADRQEKLNRLLEENRRAQKVAASEIKANAIQQQAQKQADRNEDAEIQKKSLDDFKKNQEEMAKIAQEKAAKIRKARLDAEMAVHRQALANLDEELKKNNERLSAAQSAVQQAWGWYRDRDSLAAQIREEKADDAAKKQYEKDYEKLTSRRDWREAKNLSLDMEATRRVALAREEETAARKAVIDTAESSRRTAAAIEQIEQIIKE